MNVITSVAKAWSLVLQLLIIKMNGLRISHQLGDSSLKLERNNDAYWLVKYEASDILASRQLN